MAERPLILQRFQMCGEAGAGDGGADGVLEVFGEAVGLVHGPVAGDEHVHGDEALAGRAAGLKGVGWCLLSRAAEARLSGGSPLRPSGSPACGAPPAPGSGPTAGSLNHILVI